MSKVQQYRNLILLLLIVFTSYAAVEVTDSFKTKAAISPTQPIQSTQIDKEATLAQMKQLQSTVITLKQQVAANPRDLTARQSLDMAMSLYDTLKMSLGGDEPVAESTKGQSRLLRKAIQPQVVPTTGGGCTTSATTAFTNTTPVAISAGAPSTITSTINVSGAGTYLYDVDLQTFITHTFNGDLDITLTSPSGTVVTITTDNGGSNDNVFNGTVFDDQANPGGQVPYTANNGVVTDQTYVNLTTATPLTPEEPLSAFNGQNPNGVWTLTISDDASGDGGSLNSWSLNITTLTSTPTTATSSFSNTTPVAISTGAPSTITSTINVSGAGTVLGDVDLQTFITHTFNADLDITLTSPAGTVVTITTDNGGVNDNVFNGTVFNDQANPGGQVPYTANNGVVTDQTYVNLTTATPLTPEEPLSAFNGQNPNGVWTLTISDDATGDGGSLNSWSLNLTTITCGGGGGGGAAGSLQFSAATYSIAENGVNATITVTRTGGSTGTVGVSYATSNGTATAGSDYTAASGTLSFATGITSQTFSVPVTNDLTDEFDETVNLTLSNPTGGATLGTPSTAVLTIVDDDPPASLTINNVSQSESTSPMSFTVSLTPASGKTVMVNFATANGTATAASDYTATSGILTFAPGITTQTVSVAIINDALTEANETFFVNLSNPINATIGISQGTGTIVNDDTLDHFTVYVADANNNRLQKSTNNGVSWSVIGSPGKSLGQFNAPKGVSSSLSDMVIFVADTGNNRIQRSTDGGLTWQQLADPGTAVGTVNAPQSLAYDEKNDKLYVADTGNNRIQVATAASTNSFLFTVYAGSNPGTGLGQFNQPQGIAVDGNGQIYVADTLNNRIQKNSTGLSTGWSVFAAPGTALGTVNSPKGIYVNGLGEVYIADTLNNRIQKFSSGIFSVFMTVGTVVGTVNAPEGVVSTANNLVFIGDTLNNRIQIKPTIGGSASIVGLPGINLGQFNQPSGVR